MAQGVFKRKGRPALSLPKQNGRTRKRAPVSLSKNLRETADVPQRGRGARGGGSPPRMGSHPPQPLQGKGCGEQSEDFSALERAGK